MSYEKKPNSNSGVKELKNSTEKHRWKEVQQHVPDGKRKYQWENNGQSHPKFDKKY